MNEDHIANAVKKVEAQFTTLQQQGAVHEQEIVKHQNALGQIREELIRLQGERRALVRLQDNETVPCQQNNTQSKKGTHSEQSQKSSE